VAVKHQSTVQDRLRLLASQVGGPSAFAVLLGIHRGTAYDFLKGVREPPQSRLEKIAAMYPCDLQWLLTGSGTPPAPSAARLLEAKSALKAAKEINRPGNETDEGIFGLGPRPGFDMPRGMVRRGRQAKLEDARERVLELLKMKDEALIVSVLGQPLYDEVKSGRACPSAKLLFSLAEVLEVKAAWVLGLEE
jgi:transcriptional regulator with XRE-family HTH domain